MVYRLPVAVHYTLFVLEEAKFYVLAVEYGVGVVMEPLAEIDVATGAVFQDMINGEVAVSEDEIVRWNSVKFVIGVGDEPFVGLAEEVGCFFISSTASAGKILRQPDAKVGV